MTADGDGVSLWGDGCGTLTILKPTELKTLSGQIVWYGNLLSLYKAVIKNQPATGNGARGKDMYNLIVCLRDKAGPGKQASANSPAPPAHFLERAAESQMR